MKRFVYTAALVLGLSILFTCSNEIDLLSEIQKEVKLANNLFLVIESVSPADKRTNVNPGNEIVIVFDRALDVDSVSSDTFRLYNDTQKSPEGFLSTRYNETTRTLNIKPTDKGYFDNLNDYIITISGFRGQDGSELPEDFVWSFKTGLAPAGSIVAASPEAKPNFTNQEEVTVSKLSSNLYAEEYAVSINKSELENIATISSWKAVTENFTNFSIGNTEGSIPIYYIFRGRLPDGSLANSIIGTYSVTLDKTPPSVTMSSDILYENTFGQPTATAVCSDANSDAGFAYLWERTAGAQALFGSQNSLSTTVYSLSDTSITNYIQLRVTDAAGNIGYSNERGFVRDKQAPSAPIFSSTYDEPTTDDTPSWSWTATGADYYRTALYLSSSSGSYTNQTETTYDGSLSIVGSYVFRVYSYDNAGNYAFSTDSFNLVTFPAHGATNVTTNLTIRWPSYNRATQYTLYFGESNKGQPQIYQGDNNFFTKSLSLKKTYYWYYVATGFKISYQSPVFSFQTQERFIF